MDPLLEYLDNRVSQLHDLLDDSIFPDMLDELWAILVMHCADLIIDGVSHTEELYTPINKRKIFIFL